MSSAHGTRTTAMVTKTTTTARVFQPYDWKRYLSISLLSQMYPNWATDCMDMEYDHSPPVYHSSGDIVTYHSFVIQKVLWLLLWWWWWSNPFYHRDIFVSFGALVQELTTNTTTSSNNNNNTFRGSSIDQRRTHGTSKSTIGLLSLDMYGNWCHQYWYARFDPGSGGSDCRIGNPMVVLG
jgi:hypothetical protein